MAISGSSSFYPTLDNLFMRDPFGVRELATALNKYNLTPNQVKQIVDMLTLPDGIALPTRTVHGVKTPHEPVSQARLLDIVLHVTEFHCGAQQLVDLAQLCDNKNWHLCFLSDDRYHNESHSLTADPSYNYSNMLYVYVPDVAANRQVQRQAINVAMLDPNGQLTIQRIKVIELLNNNYEKADGYLIGHELSHANANAAWYADHPNESNPLDSMSKFCDAIMQQIPPSLYGEYTSVINDNHATLTSLLSSIIGNLSEAMNVLQLEHNGNFKGSIVGEFDFLCEAKDQFCIRIPYSLEHFGAYPPKLITAFCTLIFKLKQFKQQSITLQDLENLKNALQEYNSIKDNLSNIWCILGRANYEISMVPQFFNEGSGGYYHTTDHSGFHAILEALNPSDIAVSADVMGSRAQMTANRQIAVEILHQNIANLTRDPDTKDIPNMLLGSADLKTSHLLAVVTLLQDKRHTIPPPDCSQEQLTELRKYDSALGIPRALIVIDAAQNTNTYTCINSNLEVSQSSIDEFPAQMLRSDPPPVVLLYQAGRWQACIPKLPAPRIVV
jgi:hypothetical protein